MGLVLVMLAFAVQIAWLVSLKIVRGPDGAVPLRVFSLFLLVLSGFCLALADRYMDLEEVHALWAGFALAVAFVERDLSSIYRVMIVIVAVVEMIAISQP